MKEELALWPPAYLIAYLILVSSMIFFLKNILQYNWKNGAFKARVALQVWGWAKAAHIWYVVHGYPDWAPPGIFLDISLSGILYIAMQDYIFKKHHTK